MIQMKKEGRFFIYPTHFRHSDEPFSQAQNRLRICGGSESLLFAVDVPVYLIIGRGWGHGH